MDKERHFIEISALESYVCAALEDIPNREIIGLRVYDRIERKASRSGLYPLSEEHIRGYHISPGISTLVKQEVKYSDPVETNTGRMRFNENKWDKRYFEFTGDYDTIDEIVEDLRDMGTILEERDIPDRKKA